MKPTPTITVLIPVKDNLEGLIRSLRSMRDVKENIAVLVVDDGSDPPIPSLDHLQLPFRIEVLRMPKNVGVARALNAGLRFLKDSGCDYVARLDADDLCSADRFALGLEVFRKSPETVLVGSFATMERHVGANASSYLWTVPTTPSSIARRMHLNTCFIHPTVMFRTSILDEIGLYSEQFDHAEDFEFFFRIVRRHMTCNIPQPLVTVTMRDANISIRHYRRQLLSRMSIQWKFFDWMEPLSYWGLLKSAALLTAPRWLIDAYKAARGSN